MIECESRRKEGKTKRRGKEERKEKEGREALVCRMFIGRLSGQTNKIILHSWGN